VRPDLVAVLAATGLALGGVLTPREALAGFGSPAVVAIASLLVIGAALVRTGVVRRIALSLQRIAGGSPTRLLLVSTGAPGLLSGFINIVAAVSVLIPAIRRLAQGGALPAPRLLLPMAYAGLMGANLSLIGASHNLVVHGLLEDAGHPGLGFFELTPLGAALVALTMIYSLLLGPRLLPRGVEGGGAGPPHRPLEEIYGLSERLWQLWVRPDGGAAGRSLASLALSRAHGLAVVALERGDAQEPVDRGDLRLQGDDVLLVVGRRERAEGLAAAEPGLALLEPPREGQPFPASGAELAEVVVPPRSDALGRAVRACRLRERTGLTPVALWREDRPVRTDVAEQTLAPGDALLLYGPRSAMRGFEPAPEFLWSRPPREHEAPPELRRLAPASAALFLLTLGVAAAGWLPVAIATLLGAAALVTLGALGPAQAYRAVDWRTVVLVAGMLPMGTALEQTGVAARLAEGLAGALAPLGPRGVLAGVTVATMLLTQPLHNAAVAVIMTPVALTAAELAGADPRGFAVAVVAAASAKFLLPVAHPATLLVQGPGGYRGRDYLRFGLGLQVLVLALVVLLVPLLWPL
jgi:di/tricarboxylate transporter